MKELYKLQMIYLNLFIHWPHCHHILAGIIFRRLMKIINTLKVKQIKDQKKNYLEKNNNQI